MKNSKMPLQVWVLTLAAFAIGTSEFVIAGILTQVSDSLNITEGQAGNLITAYALAIVIGGPILVIFLTRFSKRKVLIGLMGLFIIANLITAFSTNYTVLIISRVIAGLVQGPFYGIGAIVATKLVSENMAGSAIGQMFAGLTLANVLGVPAGAWIGNLYGWKSPFIFIAIFGLVAMIAIWLLIPNTTKESEKTKSFVEQIGAFKNWNLIASLIITILAWTGFMSFYGYIAPIAEKVAGFERSSLTWILVIVGLGLVIGNYFGGKTADKNLRLSLIIWPILMIISLIIIGVSSSNQLLFVVFSFVFGVVSFANVPSMQMRVMNNSGNGQELAATANISAFNVANALGGVISGVVIDSSLGASMIPFVAIIVPIVGVVFILSQKD